MGTAYLIDTHVLHWLLDAGVARKSTAIDILADSENSVVVSAVSAFEVALKVRLGKFDRARPLVDRWSHQLRRLDAIELDIKPRHALVAGSLEWAHRDPFDRLLVAQARVEGLILVSADGPMLTAPGIDVLAW